MNSNTRMINGIKGLACGDAMGAMAVGYTKKSLLEAYDCLPINLMDPIPSSKERTKWSFGQVTDDTYQTLVVAKVLAQNNKINKHELITMLNALPYKYNKPENATGKLRKDSDPNKKRFSTGNGGVMRVSPIGMMFSVEDEPEMLLNEVIKATELTHNSKSAISGACAIAFMVSAIIESRDVNYIIEKTLMGAYLGQDFGENDSFPKMYKEIERALSIGHKEIRDMTDANWGFKAIQSVPFSISLAIKTLDADTAVKEALRYGGDADSIASIAGVICGAYSPISVSEKIYKNITNLNRNYIQDIQKIFQHRASKEMILK